MDEENKPIIWLKELIKTPPFSKNARLEAGWLLRKLQLGEKLSLPDSRPMNEIGVNCHELRINDDVNKWRILYHIASEAIVILDIFKKKTNKTPKYIIENCKLRLSKYYAAIDG